MSKTKPSDLLELDARHCWHPFTQAATADAPLPIARGEGSWLYTTDGRALLDGISSWWVNLHGHSHPAIAEALYRQASTLEHVLFAGFTHEPAVQLASRLAEVLPGDLDRLFFSDNGSTAVEVGLKMALQYHHNLGHRRHRILALEGAYHGDTFGAMALSERSAFTAPFDPFMFEVHYLPAPTPGREEDALHALSAALSEGDVAVMVYEPLIQGAGGMRMYSPDALQPMLQAARKAGALLLADEVMTGFFRTGALFASMHQSTAGEPLPAPDILAMSKGLTGGTLAMGLTACTDQVYQAFYSTDKARTFYHGHSFTANPLACAVSLASLDLTLSASCREAVARIAAAQEAFCQRLQDEPRASWPRHCGTVLAFDLVPGDGTQTGYFNPIRDRIYRFFLQKGLLLRPLGNTVYCLPPYSFSEDELASVHEAMLQLLAEAENW